MAATDTTYDITSVTQLTDTCSVIAMIQNMSKFPCAVWFQDAQPDPAVTPPDVIWGGGAYEESFPNPKVTAGGAATKCWGAPAGNARFTRMRVIHQDAT